MISTLAISSGVSLLFPASLYIWPGAIYSNRDHPRTIQRNFISVTLASIVSLIILAVTKHYFDLSPLTISIVWQSLNPTKYSSHSEFLFVAIVHPLLLCGLLFLGPIFMEVCQRLRVLIGKSSPSKGGFESSTYTAERIILLLRAVIIAPISEEIMFRGVLIRVLEYEFASKQAILISSVMFGLMHYHQSLKLCLLTRQILIQQLLIGTFQCLYTSLFGLYAGTAYSKSGHILTPIVLHCFCNTLGLPDFSSILASKTYSTITAAGFFAWSYFLLF